MVSAEVHAAAAAAVTRPVALDALVLSPEYQLRERLEQWKVEEYAAVFDRLPPVLAARIRSDLVLLDGFHRVAAARILGRELIDARIECVDADHAFLLTVRANAGHGLPLKTKEKKAAARGLLRRFPERSDRWIAQDVGLSDKTVTELRRAMESGAEIPHLSHTEGRDGKHYACLSAACVPPVEEEPAREAAEPGGARPSEYDVAEWPADEDGEAPLPGGCVAHAVPAGLTRDGMASWPGAPAEGDAIRFIGFSVPGAEFARRGDAPNPINRIEGAGGGPAVTIVEGDARRLREWVTDEVHLVVTSPPYNVGIPYSVHDDSLPDAEYQALLAETFAACHAVMAEGARIAVVAPFGLGRDPWVPCAARVAALLEGAGFTLRGQIVWDKGTTGNRTSWGSFRLPTDPCLRDRTEAIVVAHKGAGTLALPAGLACRDSEGSYSPLLADPDLFLELAQDFWRVPPESARRVGHPAPFPGALAEGLMRLYAYPGAHVLDPFGGSGTVGVAALRLGLSATLIDVDPAYCRLAAERCARAAAV